MASLREKLGAGLSGLGIKLAGGANALKERILYPSSGIKDNLVRDFLRYPPGANTLDIRPVRSISSANGYMIYVAPEYWDLLDEMYESDEILRMCLELMVAYMLMRPQGLRVEEDDRAEDPQAGEIIDFFNDRILNNPKVNFRYLCWALAIGILRHGRSTLETMWHVSSDGYFLPCQFIHCHPGQFGFDSQNRMYLTGYKQDQSSEVHPLKFISAVNSSLYDNPWGDSKLFPYRYKYQYKKRVLIAKLQYLEWFGSPIIHGKVKGGSSEKKQLMAEFEAAIQRLNSSMALVTGNDEEIDVHQRSSAGLGGGSGIHDSILDRLDSYFTKSLLGAELTTTVKDRGARSLGEVQERTVLNKILPLARLVETALNLYLFDPVRVMNFGPGSPTVRYWFDTEEATDAREARETLDSATKNGVPVTVRQAQEMLGIYPANDGDELLKRPQSVVNVARVKPADEDNESEDERTDIDLPDDDEIEEDNDLAAIETVITRKDGSVERSYHEFPNKVVAAAGTKKVIEFGKWGQRTEDAVKRFQGGTKFSHDYACTMLDMSEWIRMVAKSIIDQIAEEDVYTEVDDKGEQKYGREFDSHVTVLYGILPEVTLEQVESAAGGAYWQFIDFGKLNYFELENCDVVYVEVEKNAELMELRSYIELLPYENPREYVPHMTLCYVKKGMAPKVIEQLGEYCMDGEFDFVDYLTYSDTEDNKHLIALTGPLVEMSVEGTTQALENIMQRTKSSAAELWKHEGIAGTAFRETIRQRSMAAELQASEWIEKLSEVVVEDTRQQLIDSVKATARGLEKYGRDSRMTANMTSEANIGPVEVQASARRIVLASFMIRRYVADKQLDYVAEEKSDRKFDAAEDLIGQLPEGFRDAAEWMASRGVMTVENVAALASAMADQMGGTAKEWESQLREQYLALARVAETGATKKIQGMIEKAVGQGRTLNDFLQDVGGLIEAGDLPGSLDTYWETVFRTEVGNAYKQAQIIHESDPDFEPYHWGWEGYNPADDRSDPTHAAIKGKFFKKGSAAAAALGLPPFRYNCRCSMYALMSPDPERPEYEQSSDAMSVASRVTRF